MSLFVSALRARDLFQKLKGPKQPGEEVENPTAVVTGAEVRSFRRLSAELTLPPPAS